MKAILNQDKIVKLIMTGGAEIGSIPKGVGLERLRFDGEQIIDLATLSQIWVRAVAKDAFELHAVEVPGAQLVDMTYRERRRLTQDPDGTIRLLTDDEIKDARIQQELNIEVKEQLTYREKNDSLLQRFVRATPEQLETYIENNVTDMQSAKEALKKLAVLCRYMIIKAR